MRGMHPMLTIAVKAARRAGNLINRGARDLDLLTVTAKGPKDFVSEIDRAAEAAIVQTLHAAYPDHAILAEEGTAKGANANAEYCWIIDPLDGTTNFLHGFPQYCVSIALQQRGHITQAVVYDPVRNDLFTATRGRGAFLNDRRIRVSRRQHLREALIGTGFPFRDGSNLEPYVRMMPAATTVSSNWDSIRGTWPRGACSFWKPAAWWAISPEKGIIFTADR